MLFRQITDPFRYEKLIKPEALQSGKPAKKTKAKDAAGTVKRIWNLLTVKKGLFYSVIFLVVCSSALALLGPVLIGQIIDRYIYGGDRGSMAASLAVLLAVYAGYSLTMWLQNYIIIGLSQDTIKLLRTKLFSHFHELPMRFFDTRQRGELMSRITNDMENVSSTLNSSVIQVLSSILTLAGTVSVMIWLSPGLTAITLLVIPLMFLAMKWITKRTGKLFQLQQKSLGELNGSIQESISGQRIIKAFSQEKETEAEFLERAENLKLTGFWAQVYSGMIPKVMNLLNNVSFAVIAGFGGYFAYKGWITIGVIVVFIEFSRQFTRPLNDLANQLNTMLSAVAGAERVFEIMDSDTEVHDEAGRKELPALRGEVVFQDVSFSYGEGEPILKDFNIHANAGDMVALVGPTGAGKSTVFNLLAGFYPFNEGRILMDGKDSKRYTRDSIRKQMSFVLQEPFLFEGTILENIRYGRLDASDSEVEQAAREANAHSFIQRLPHDYQTVLKDGGEDLSQGQKQLLAISRAILADPAILLLDEATSSIDTITEMDIQKALKRLMAGRTSFVIAHRLNTVREADQIIVLQDGKVTESGTHEALLKKKGFYAELVEAGFEDA